MTATYVVTACSLNRYSRRQTSDPRREKIDPATNALFAACRTPLDVEQRYEAFWNDLNDSTPEIVKVLGVETLVHVCSYCPDVRDQTAAARAHGFEVTHGICPACNARENAALDREEASRAAKP